ncbi:MAG: response regulator transcription factor [Elusimicrobiota bacterium]
MIIEDDISFGPLLHTTLERHGYETELAATGSAGLEQACALRPDLILLDINLPDVDGIKIYEAVKRNPLTKDIPVLLMTGADFLDSLLEAAVLGLQAEPVFRKGDCDMSQLLQRIGTMLCAHTRMPAGPPPDQTGAAYVLRRGPVALDLVKRELTVAGLGSQQLRARRFDLLYVLLQSGRPLTRRDLLRKVWKDSENFNTVEVTVKRLREDLKTYACIRIESTPEGYQLLIDHGSEAGR